LPSTDNEKYSPSIRGELNDQTGFYSTHSSSSEYETVSSPLVKRIKYIPNDELNYQTGLYSTQFPSSENETVCNLSSAENETNHICPLLKMKLSILSESRE
jgi:hypothetical protein